jgi:iron complex outermembrane recepter protein
MKYYISIVLICFLQFIYSQSCVSQFSGIVSDFHNGKPIADASLYIKSQNKYTTSDQEGRFLFNNLCDGNILVSVSHIGCETKEFTIKIKGSTFFAIHLEHHIEELTAIKIKGTKGFLINATTQETHLSTNELEKNSALNLGDALKQITGVSSINTGNTIVKPVINGMHSSRVVVITNGLRLQDQEWGVEHAPNIDLNSVGNVTVIKGSNALAYGGDAIGGVIVLQPETISLKDSIYGKTISSIHSNGNGYNLHSGLNKTYRSGWYHRAQITTKRFGDFEAPNYVLTNTGLVSKSFSVNSGFKKFEYGFSAMFSYLQSEIGILSASHIGNIEDLVNAINNQAPLVVKDFSYAINAPRQEVSHQIAKIDGYYRFKKFGRLDIQYDFQNNQRFEYDLRRATDTDMASIDLNLKTHAIRAVLKLDASNLMKHEFGVNGSFQDNIANPATGVRRLIPDYLKFDFGIFALSNLQLNDKTKLDLGVRYDFSQIDAKKFYIKSRWESQGYQNDFGDLVIDELDTQLLVNPVFTYQNISASAGIAYQLNDSNTFVFNYGLSNRAPNPSELFSDGLHHSAARIELGDLRIKQETSNRFSASYQCNTQFFNFNVETFYNYVNDFILIEPLGTELTIRGAFPVWNYKQTNAALFGIDITAKYRLDSHWSLTNQSAMIKGIDLGRNQPLIDMPAFKTVCGLVYSNQKYWNLHAQLRSESVLSQNEYPNNNFETYLATSNTIALVNISTPPPAYHLVHFNSDVSFQLSNKTKLNVGLNITNIFNITYRDFLNRLRYFADDLGRNISIQLKLNY